MANKDFKVKNGLTVNEVLSVGGSIIIDGSSGELNALSAGNVCATCTNRGFVSAGRDLADIFAPSAGNITGVTAGTGLSGGGTEGDVTIDVGRGDGIGLTADTIAVDSTVVRTTGAQTIGGCKTFTANTTITGNLSVTGDITYIDTTVTVTSALSVVNDGTGPALFVRQDGSEPIAHFVDKNGGDIVLLTMVILELVLIAQQKNSLYPVI